MTDLFPQLAQRVLNRPLAIHPGKAEVIMAAIGERLGVSHVTFVGSKFEAMSEFDSFEDEGSNPRGGYDLVEGVAIIPIRDTLVQRTGTLQPYSGMTGYDGIRQNFLTAIHDPAVRAIVLDIDSPGGEVSGCFDLCDTIYAARGIKPIAGILSENAYSAAFGIASSVDPGRLTVPRTGGTGSVGVIYMHVSQQGFLKQVGLEVTLITKGDLKGEGNEFENLSADAFARLKADVETVGSLFDRTVARNRGIDVQAVFDTQAGTYLGEAGVAVGFADAVMAPDEAFAALLDDIS